jgi:acetolactate synthase I/II/III large subunit
MKLSDYVMRFIAAAGVKHVFMLPGGGAMHLDDSVGRCKDLQFVCTLHEQAASIAAEAYARATNHLGVALVTSGPGGTNAITGLAGAWLASTPCLFVSGQVKRSDLKGDSGVRQRGPQELDIVAVVQSITKYAALVTDPASIRFHLEKAVALATSGRKGPVWIDIPLDVQATQIDPDSLVGFEGLGEEALGDEAALQANVARALALLSEAQRPVLLAGNGVHHSGAKADFVELVRRLQVPVLTTWAGADLLSYDDPLYVGRPGTIGSRPANFAVQNSDLVLSLGARLDFDVTGFNQAQYARAARKIVVEIDPAELRKFTAMTIDLSVLADCGRFIREMNRQLAGSAGRKCGEWADRCRRWKEKYPVVLPEYWQNERWVNTYVFAKVLCEETVAGDLVVPGSSGAGIDMFWMAYEGKEGQRAFSTGGLGAMGFGIPAGIGACLGSGGRRTITVDGDGGFYMNIQELAAVAHLNLPIKYFVLNNQGYASIRMMQRNHFQGHLVGCDATSGLALPDTVAVARAFGITATRIETHARMREQIREVLAQPGPTVCDVLVDPDLLVSPRARSVVRPDGSIVSAPLEDLWPPLDRDEFRGNMIVPPLEVSSIEVAPSTAGSAKPAGR